MAVSTACNAPPDDSAPGTQLFLDGFFLAGSAATYSNDFLIHGFALLFDDRHAAGSVTYPPIGRSAGPNGPAPSLRSSLSRSSSPSLTPTSAPKRPMNMLPFTNPPRLPNMGLTSTWGSSGTRERKYCLSSSV